MLFGEGQRKSEQHIPRLGEAKFILSVVEGLGMTQFLFCFYLFLSAFICG